MKISVAAFLPLSVCFAAITQAATETPYFKTPADFNGTGCPISSVTVTGADSPMLTLMFNQYDAAKPLDKARSKMERTACSFAVPIHVPAGYQVSLLTADWMGYAKGGTELFREYFFVGQTGRRKTSNPSLDFIEQDQNMNFSSCAEDGEKDIILRINSSVQAMQTESYIAIDSLDQSLILKLQLEKCPNPLSAVYNLLL